MKIKSPLFPIFLVLISLLLKSFSGPLFSSISFFEDEYLNKHLIKTGVNVILSICYLSFIFNSKISNQLRLFGDSKFKFQLITFPLFYAAIVNLVFFEFEGDLKLKYLIALLFSTLSVGLVEELSIRGIIQNQLIEFYGEHRKGIIKSIVLSSFLFALMHLINFDKGVWGEIAQLFYSLFIGLAFGVVLFITKRIYPLIIIHGLIDFAAGLDRLGVVNNVQNTSSWENSLFVILLLFPYLIYGLLLFKTH